MDYTLKGLLKNTFCHYADNILIADSQSNMTYKMVNGLANALGAQLENSNVTIGSYVVCFSSKPQNHIVCFLACIKYGFVYIPVDPMYPDGHLNELYSQIKATVVCDEELLERNKKFFAKQNAVVQYKYYHCPSDYDDRWVDIDNNSASYIYFTSGTTGQPKGIIGGIKGLAHFIQWEINELQLDDQLCIAQFTPPFHDPFLRDVLVPMSVGGKICIPDSHEMMITPEKIVKWLEINQVSLIHCTPSMFHIISSEKLSFDRIPALKYVLLAGEQLHSSLIKKWMEIFGERIIFINLYGPTETTLAKLYHRVTPDDMNTSIVPVGKCIPGAKALVIDEKLQICRKMQYGEVLIRTPYRSLGYINPELNENKFIQNPFSDKEGDIVFRTGDRGRLLQNGEIEISGRIDRQIKIRGHRIEMSEIENALDTLEGVIRSAVVFKESEELLYAFIQLDPKHDELDMHSIYNRIAERLPDYMLPGKIIQVKEPLPMTKNRKLDYQQLIKLTEHIDCAAIEAQSPTENMLRKICKEVLLKDNVSMSDTLFQLGISSINIMRFVNAVNDHTGGKITMSDVFTNRTMSLSELAAYLDSRQDNIELSEQLSVVPIMEDYPTALAQRRIYLMQQMDSNTLIYNITRAFKISTGVELSSIEKAFSRLINENEIFRTYFVTKNGEIRQKILPHIDFKLEYIDSDTANISKIITCFRRPFDLSNPPLLRAAVIRMSNGSNVLVVDVHHIIIDGRSLVLAMNKVTGYMMGINCKQELVTYRSFAEWQNKKILNGALDNDKAYWLNRLKDKVDVIELYSDKQRPAFFSYKGTKINTTINSSLRMLVKQKAVCCNTTEFVVLLTAYYLLLYRYTGNRRITVGTVVNGRELQQTQDMIGMFVNTLAIRNDINPSDKISKLLETIHNNVYEDIKHQTLPFELLVDMLGLQHDASRNPLFDYMFVFQEQHSEDLSSDFEMLEIDDNSSKYDMTLELTPFKNEIKVVLEYCTDIYSEGDAIYILTHYLNILFMLCSTDESDIVDNISCVSPQEKELLLKKCRHSMDTPLPYHSVCEWFRDTAAKYSEKTAIVNNDRSLTYRQLDEETDYLAAELYNENVRSGHYVGVCATNTIEMVEAAIAVLKLGAAYVPIDSNLPSERINYIIQDCRASVVLTDKSVDVQFNSIKALRIRDIIDSHTDKHYTEYPISADDPAYVIYTSGTTGQPKGIILTNENLITYIYAFSDYVAKKKEFTMLQMASISFDVSVEEIFCTLLLGGKLVMLTKEEMLDQEYVCNIIRKYDVDYASMSPQYAKLFGELPKIYNFECCFVGGEVVTARCVHNLSNYTRIVNAYGPTEATISATYYEYDPLSKEDKVPIGYPLLGYNVYILDEKHRLCGFNIPGEICISGRAVSRGYLNLPEQTKKAFCLDPFDGSRMYCTGDRAVIRPNGVISFISRIDKQIKLRGYRIELEEIEQCAVESGLIQDFSAGIYKSAAGEDMLCGAYISKTNVNEQLYRWLAEKLPAYMIPSFLVKVDFFPTTMNGKIDRNKLSDIFAHHNIQKTITAPQTDAELKLAQIWKRILNVDTISVNENFWTAGGNSILAIQMVREATEQGFGFSINEVFSNMTLVDLASITIANNQSEFTPENVCKYVNDHTQFNVRINEDNFELIMYIDTEYSTDAEEQLLSVLRELNNAENRLLRFAWKAQKAPKKIVFPPMCILKQLPNGSYKNAQPAQYYYIMIDKQCCFDDIGIIGFYSKDMMLHGIVRLIAKQPMLRAGYTRKGNVYECAVPKEEEIPYVDLTSLNEADLEHRLEHFKKLLCSGPLTRKTTWRMLVVRTKANEHRLLLYINHAFYDLYSGAAIKISLNNILNGTTSPIISTNTIEEKYNSFDINKLDMPRFCVLSEQFSRLASGIAAGRSRVRCNYQLTGQIGENKIINYAVSRILEVFQSIYQLDNFPVWMLYHGRGIDNNADFTKVGAFMDIVPMFLDKKNVNDFAEEFEHRTQMLMKSDISFGRAMMGHEPKLKNETWLKALRKMVFRQFIVINYQGLDVADSANSTDWNINKNMAIVSYNGTAIKITYCLPINIREIEKNIFGEDYTVL